MKRYNRYKVGEIMSENNKNTKKKKDTEKITKRINRNLFENFEDNEFFEAQEQQNAFNEGKLDEETLEKEKIIRKAREIMRTSDV